MNSPNHKIRYKKNAFTILELLVVIGIIALLVTAAAVSYSSVQKKARDTRRKTDLKAIQDAFEQYYSTCGFLYPTLAAGPLPAVGSPGNPLTCANPPATFITYPKDPLGGNYQCAGPCINTSYTVCPPDLGGEAYLETETCNVTNQNCCLRNQQ